MGFFFSGNKASATKAQGLSIDFLHKNGCKVCPLNGQEGLHHPSMTAYGSRLADVYMLGEAPGEQEDRKGRPFVGKAGSTLRFRLPGLTEVDGESVFKCSGGTELNLRWNNTVRTRPPKNREPTNVELECCRPSVIRDVEEAAPKVIFGFGNIPLQWALGFQGITGWRGRRFPIKVGKHTCWFFPMLHPSFVMRKRRFEPRNRDEYGSEDEFAFAKDLERAFAAMETLPEPVVHTKDDVLADTDCYVGDEPGAVNKVLQFIENCYQYKDVGFDWETNALRPYHEKSRILSWALSNVDHTIAVAMDHKESKWSDEDYDLIFHALKKFLYSNKVRKIAHNLAFELEWACEFFGQPLVHKGRWGDSQAQAYILDERTDRKGLLSLEWCVIEAFGVNLKAIANVDRNNLASTPIMEVLRYNAPDAKYARLIHHRQRERLLDAGLQSVYAKHIQRVLAAVLVQRRGVPIDQKVNKQFEKELLKKIDKAEQVITDLEVVRKFKKKKGAEFRPSANHDVKYLLNNVLGMNVESVNEKTIAQIKHPIVSRILAWRKLSKQLSTYVLSVSSNPEPPEKPSLMVYPDKLLHPQLNTMRVVTWRTSSDDPNIQNWPNRKNREIRSQVRPGIGQKVVSFDYAGIQARNVAMESKDRTLIQQFWDRYDIHGDWTERTVRIYPKFFAEGVKALHTDKDLFKSYRNRLKNGFVFPSFFGAQARSLAIYLGMPETTVERMHEEFYDQYPRVLKWQKGCWDFYREHGYITGLSGFRRRAPIERNQLINAPIQADESLIVCDAMYRLTKYDDTRLIPNLMVHDDLTFIWDEKDIDKLAPKVIKEMIRIEYDWLNVPLQVEMKVGDDWANQKDAGEFASDTYKGPDPNRGTWADGDGWANHRGDEGTFKRKRS